MNQSRKEKQLENIILFISKLIELKKKKSKKPFCCSKTLVLQGSFYNYHNYTKIKKRKINKNKKISEKRMI